MNRVQVAIWLVIFLAIMIVFNLSFQLVYTPAGLMGRIPSANLIASATYLISWLVLSVISGIKRRKEILIATLIYSAMPLLGFIGALFMGTPLALLIMFIFYWTVPIQGIFIGNEHLIVSGLVLQPLIFCVGYFLSQTIKHTIGTKAL